jgi:hypothetical protein
MLLGPTTQIALEGAGVNAIANHLQKGRGTRPRQLKSVFI